MNGWEGSGGSICNRRARKQGMGVLTEARVTIFVAVTNAGKQQKKEQQQTSKKNLKQIQINYIAMIITFSSIA